VENGKWKIETAMSIEPQIYKKDWVMTAEAFDLMLAQLDADREQAGEKYELIRQKLTKFFQWRGCPSPEDYTDRTIDRVARRLLEGAEVHARDPYLFFHGTAINVLREHWKKAETGNVESLDDLPVPKTPAEDPLAQRARREERLAHEVKLECLQECVQSLPREQIEQIQQYHQSDGGAKIAQRKAMAEQLGIPLNALRIRMYRLRQELETCILDCTQRLVRPHPAGRLAGK
jgi:DNA-directed RNA polymerase specialized sigma24 family protein